MASLTRLIPERVRRSLWERFTRIETARVYELVLDSSYRPLDGMTALVTGASGAIGRAIAIRLAADGASVVAVARSAQKLDALVEEIGSLGGVAQAEPLDLTDAASLQSAADRLGRIDVLVNNAGGSSRAKYAHVWDQTAETVDEVLSINLRATMLATGAFGKGMVASGAGGRIINLGSTAGLGGLSKFSDYAAVKAGVVGFTRSAALEFGPHGVTVNCVTPGVVQRGQIAPSVVVETLAKGVVPRLGRAEDIAEMVGFLAGPRAGWITGQEFVVDGGRSIGLHGEP